MLAHKYFENKLSSPSTEDEGDDIDYDYQEVRSFDRSSAGSIPWAEDAIKKNQQEWERIESYFNSEDDEYLPTEDKDLCREILEWRRFFRENKDICKNNIKEIQGSNTSHKSRDNEIDSDDETLIENSTTSTAKSSKIPLRDLLSISKINQNDNRFNKKQSAKSVNFPINSTNHANVKTLSKDFAKDLRIGSVPKNNKRTSFFQNNYFSPTTQNLQQPIPVKIIQHHYPQPHQFFPSQSAKYLLDKYPDAIVTIEKKISPHSATYSRITPVYNLIKTGNSKTFPVFNQLQQYQPRYSITRNVGRYQKNQITLPSLNVMHSKVLPSSTNVQANHLRSISAVNHNHYENRQVRKISELNGIEYLPSLSASNKYKYHS